MGYVVKQQMEVNYKESYDLRAQHSRRRPLAVAVKKMPFTEEIKPGATKKVTKYTFQQTVLHASGQLPPSHRYGGKPSDGKAKVEQVGKRRDPNPKLYHPVAIINQAYPNSFIIPGFLSTGRFCASIFTMLFVKSKVPFG